MRQMILSGGAQWVAILLLGAALTWLAISHRQHERDAETRYLDLHSRYEAILAALKALTDLVRGEALPEPPEPPEPQRRRHLRRVAGIGLPVLLALSLLAWVADDPVFLSPSGPQVMSPSTPAIDRDSPSTPTPSTTDTPSSPRPTLAPDVVEQAAAPPTSTPSTRRPPAGPIPPITATMTEPPSTTTPPTATETTPPAVQCLAKVDALGVLRLCL